MHPLTQHIAMLRSGQKVSIVSMQALHSGEVVDASYSLVSESLRPFQNVTKQNSNNEALTILWLQPFPSPPLSAEPISLQHSFCGPFPSELSTLDYF